MDVKNNRENSFTTKVSEHIPSGCLMLQYHHLKTQNISMMDIEVKIV